MSGSETNTFECQKAHLSNGIKREIEKKKSEMAVAGLYRRILPSPPAIEFASDDGKVSSLSPSISCLADFLIELYLNFLLICLRSRV